ncbi:hypothetical protein C2E21_4989 [Chlorella sorokiniana]|uniref:Uncharacterized protein n=1 Tax=Chlorella sorokiniana TaxID=3076 RepID=A0A2P6TPD5_CHLSO|nr:hypothetical protein C2E21_4989 [Chlorella sorokiniana]|eukprot:PRW55897.1 hypothetical protein C2E21_4989 [Chlorella sorokiniana]
MLLRLLLAQLLLTAARAADGEKPEEGGDKGEPSELFLFCNTTSTCLACGALRLNEHCRTDGGYQLQTCVVDTADGPHSLGTDSRRPLKGKHSLERGAVVKQHTGCKPTSRVSVASFLLGCAAAAVAALGVIRWRQRQRF